MSIDKNNISGVILAGGQARRMGGEDKGLIMLKNKPMIEYIINAMQNQTGTLMINANRNHDQYAKYGLEIIKDDLSGYCGPLAGMAAALNTIKSDFIVTVPCDSPFVPNDLVKRLAEAMADNNAEISVAHNGERMQPVFCMLKQSLKPSLDEFLSSGERKIDKWFELHKTSIADFSDIPQTFDNINTPEDIKSAEEKL